MTSHFKSPQHSRRKGMQWERDLVKLFQEAMPSATVRRGLQYRSGEDAPDVECPVFWIEAKRGLKPNVRGALKQAAHNAPEGRIPLAIIRDDRREPFVVLALQDFLDVVAEWWKERICAA